MSRYKYSEKRKEMISHLEEQPFKVGDQVLVEGKEKFYKVLEIISEDEMVVQDFYKHQTPTKVPTTKVRRNEFMIGANPFEKWGVLKIRTVNYDLGSILGVFNREITRGENYKIKGIEVQEMNWNPFVYLPNGKKFYFQRKKVWSLEDKQNLIESIYMGSSCGMVVVRTFEWKELERRAAAGEKELFFKEVIDGKQRISTIIEFMNDGFCDRYGNYFSDLNNRAQLDFTNHQLIGYGEMEQADDRSVLMQFLKTNVAGVPQSAEHLKKVANVLDMF
jgi:hypothetical protein